MSREITPELLAAAKRTYGDGLHRFTECPRCGHLDWSSTTRDKPEGALITPLDEFLDNRRCRRCDEAHARGPEIVEWVLAVVAKARRDCASTAKATDTE